MRKIFPEKTTKKTARTTEDSFYLIGSILFAVVTALATAYSLWPEPGHTLPPCLFHLFSGYYCPGCGGTRAVRALLHGHILQAVYFYPAVPYGAAVYLYFMATQTAERLSHGKLRIGMRYHNCYVWIAVAMILGNFLAKNILHYLYGFTL